MLVAYASYLFFQLRSQHKFNDSVDAVPVEVSSLPWLLRCSGIEYYLRGGVVYNFFVLYSVLVFIAGKKQSEDSDVEEVADITQWEAIGWLSILTLWVSVLSGYLVNTLQGASDSWNMPVSFISVIVLPIVGNAAEHASAIMFAMKDKLIPFCVVVGWFMGKPMDLNFQLFETATLFITVLVVAFMLQVGPSVCVLY
ncbi:hypothetical protein C3L33_14761, partial [Rhododendron williamsianum]